MPPLRILSRWFFAAVVIVSLMNVGCRPTRTVDSVEAVKGTASLAAGQPAVTSHPNDWPWWWGPHRNGISNSQQVPVEWSENQNVIWSTPIDGRGHSSPCVWQDKVFLTTGLQGPDQQVLLCIDRATGAPSWRQVVHAGGQMKMHHKNSQASPTPACDGQHVFVAFINDGALRVSAYTVDGKLAWQESAGPFTSEHGYGSSPVLYGSAVIVLGDNLSGSFIAALDRSTGKLLWRTPRPTSGRHGSYATPIVAEIAGKPQVVMTGMSQTTSYDPVTGQELWVCEGPAEVTAGTVAASDELVFASGGYPEKEVLAIRADGSGNVTESHVAWRSRRGVCYVPSPLYFDGHLYVVSDDGVMTCYDAKTGDRLRQRRLEGDFSASPILAEGKLYVPNETGTTFVIRADPSLEILARNTLGDGGFASTSIAGGQIFLRTLDRLYCLGSTEAK